MLTVKYRGKTYPVESVEAAAAKWEEFRHAAICAGGGGVSEIGNGVAVCDESGAIVAKVSYNGRIWPVTGNGNLWPRVAVQP